MKIRNFILILFNSVLLCNCVFSQTPHDFTVYFNNNSDEINWDGKHEIDSVLKLLSGRASQYHLDLVGYSDNVGSKHSNKKLSSKRAEQVANYFIKYGFLSTLISAEGVGFVPSSLINEQALHRKVEIKIYLKLPKTQLLKDSLPRFEKFIIESKFGGNITTKNGTHLFIPDGVFVDKDGNDIKGQIAILYREFRTIPDFLQRNVPFNDNRQSRLFNSVGMFDLQVYSNGLPIFLKPNRSIEIIFGLNQRLSLLNLYYYSPDTLLNWIFKRYITDGRGVYTENRNSISCGGVTNYDYCFEMGSCTEIQFLINKGLEYAKSSLSISEELKKWDTVQKHLIQPLKFKIDSILNFFVTISNKYAIAKRELKKIDTLIYKIEGLKRTSKKAFFYIRCDASEFNEIRELKGINFKVKGEIPDSLFKIEWDQCKVTSNKINKGSIKLEFKGEKLRLRNTKLLFAKPKVKHLNRYSAYKTYKKALKLRLMEVEKRRNIVDSLSQELEAKQTQMSQLNDSLNEMQRKYYDLKLYEFKCLREKSKAYMDKKEKVLSFEGWITYFDRNKGLMANRYEKIKGNNFPMYAECNKIAKKRYNAILSAVYPYKKKEIKRDTVITTLNITQFGLYTIARPYSIHKFSTNKQLLHRIQVNEYFLDSVPLEISVVYVVYSKYTGFYRFDGSFHYSPYNLPQISDCTIIVFDDKGRVYITSLGKNQKLGEKINLHLKNVDLMNLPFN